MRITRIDPLSAASACWFLILILLLSAGSSCTGVEPPAPVGPLPSERQLAWHPLEYYAFVHFNMNTFTDMEWGTGAESPEQFHPTKLDTRQWARVARDAGMKGIILTAKHHDGFCLWPTATTGHSVKNSSWKNGRGDVLRELSEACREFGLKFGVYLSPWDRNNKDYGKPAYVATFHSQLRELLTNYGEVFEVWFDGANGGSGYYGGANETRKIDSKTYYEWDKVVAIVRELQPGAVIFSDGGPDIRWVGNEDGKANETNWSIMRRDEIYPGWPRYVELRSGHEDGTHWLPAEADVSIRPGWYYHPSEDHRVKTLPELLEIYYQSVGRNAALLLNLPVDRRGQVHETDVSRLLQLRRQLELDFREDLGKGAAVVASGYRGNAREFSPGNVTDGNADSYWTTDNGITEASLTLSFASPVEVNRMVLQEYIALGQRVQQFSVEAEVNGEWQEINRQTTIGFKRILKFETVRVAKIRVNVLMAKGPPAISHIAVFKAPNLLTEPEISRNKEGLVRIGSADKHLVCYYTLDGSDPTPSSLRYRDPFPADKPVTVRAIAVDPEGQRKSGMVEKSFDISKKDWKVVAAGSGNTGEATRMIDDDPKTFWATEEGAANPTEMVIDMGKASELKGVTYFPMQERWAFGIITAYELSTSPDGRQWKIVSRGEFGNIVNNPVEQKIFFDPTRARFIKLKALKVAGEDSRTSIGELGVLTTK